MEEKWSDGQRELFYALGKICDKVGREGAKELLREGLNGGELNASDGGALNLELRELRHRAGLVDGLQRENLRLRAELDAALRQLDTSSAEMSSRTKGEDEEATYRSSGVQTTPDHAGEGNYEWSGRYGRLIQQHNTLVKNHQDLMFARKKLEGKLRSCQSSRREWTDYAGALVNKIARLEKKLTNHAVPLRDASKGSSTSPPRFPSSLHGSVSVGLSDTSLETLNRELPKFLYMSERIAELARNAAGGLPGHLPISIQSPLTHHSNHQQGLSGRTNTPLSLANHKPRLQLDTNILERCVSNPSPKFLMYRDMEAHPEEGTARPVSPQFHHSGTTEEDIDANLNILNSEKVHVLSLPINVEPLSDTPTVISSRSVRKSKNRTGMGLNEPIPHTKVKVEDITSSPIGLVGLQSLSPQGSMDLDEIGEKMITPKKRRQVMQSSNSYVSCAFQGQVEFQDNRNQGSARSIGSVGLHQGESNIRPKGVLLPLQPSSSNKPILSLASGKERKPKRRWLEDSLIILAEDGENDVISKTASEANVSADKRRKVLPTGATRLGRRLSGLLEEPVSEKEILTPARPLVFPAEAIHTNKIERPATPVRHQIEVDTMLSGLATSRDISTISHKPSVAKRRNARTPKVSGTLEADCSDGKPLRARPLRQLCLEHFKINPRYNSGFAYAFADVVRGREARRCLPGCTKPECCGDKFRKFIEFTTRQEQRSQSQEEEDERLLEDFLGDNKGRLLNMSRREREELLIQAKTRQLSNKASKHRHAYERRRSPPGFWRSDFPSTQELLVDRQEAAKFERELIQQRYEEAMRPGGRWLFRDE